MSDENETNDNSDEMTEKEKQDYQRGQQIEAALGNYLNDDQYYWLDYDFSQHTALELLALGLYFIRHQLGAWLWVTTGEASGGSDRREIEDWMVVVYKVCEALAVKLGFSVEEGDLTVKDVLAYFYGKEIGLFQRQVDLMCEGRFDLLRDAMGIYYDEDTASWVARQISSHSMCYLGGVFTLPKELWMAPVQHDGVYAEELDSGEDLSPEEEAVVDAAFMAELEAEGLKIDWDESVEDSSEDDANQDAGPDTDGSKEIAQ